MPMPVSETVNSTQSAPVGHLAHPQRHLALLGELAGIAQEIEQDLPQPHGVDGQRPTGCPAHSTMSRFLFCSASCPAVPITSSISGADVDGFGLELELAGFDLGEVEHLVDQAEQMTVPAPMHALERLERLLRAEARRIGDASSR